MAQAKKTNSKGRGKKRLANERSNPPSASSSTSTTPEKAVESLDKSRETPEVVSGTASVKGMKTVSSKTVPMDRQGIKRRHASPSPERRRLDFGQQGDVHASLLAAKGKNSSKSGGRRARVVAASTYDLNERNNKDKPTSDGDISERARRARLDSTSEFRGEYHNLCFQSHKECFKSPWSKCMCGSAGLAASPPGAKEGTPQAADGSVGVGELCTSRVDDTNDIESMMAREGFIPLPDGAAEANGAAQSGTGEPEAREGSGMAEILAARFIDTMSERVEGQFAKVRNQESLHDASFVKETRISFDSFKVQVEKRTSLERLKSQVDLPNLTEGGVQNQSDSVPGPRRAAARRQGLRASVPNSLWKRERRSRLSRQERAEQNQRYPPQPSPEAPLVLSEENKAHLKIIATSIISDMLPGIQRLVASDDRIMRWNLTASKRLKDKIIRNYRAELKAKRKNEISLLRTTAILAKEAVSTKAFRAIRKVLVDLGLGWALPTERDLTDAKEHMRELAVDDLELYATPDGWFAAVRQVVEHEADRLLQMPAENATRDESGARSIGHAGPGMHNWQEVLSCKITGDARTITKKCSITEFMLHVFRKGEQAAADSQRALAMRTLGMWLGKDSRENVQANATEFFKQCKSLQNEGLVFDRELQTFLGRSKVFSELSEEEKLAEEKAAPDQKR
jgi:hypothetical protein